MTGGPATPCTLRMARVADGCGGTVQLSDVDSERLVIRFRPILQDTEPNLLAQHDRALAGTAEVNAGVDSMTKGDVVREFDQFSVNGQTVPVRSGVGDERGAIITGHHHIAASGLQKGPDRLRAIKEEFQCCDAGATHGAVARRIAGMPWRALRKRLWQ